MKSACKTRIWIRDVNRSDARKLVRWWNGNDKSALYLVRRDGRKTKERGRLFNVYKQPFCG